MSQSVPQMQQSSGYRWHKWINVDTEPCPPWGVISVAYEFPLEGSQVIGTEVVFKGRRVQIYPANGPLWHYWDEGVPWNLGFTSEQAVQPGEMGLVTFDQPAWALVPDNAQIGGFVTLSDYLRFSLWQLTHIPPNVQAEFIPYYNGFRIFAIRYFPELAAIWNADDPLNVSATYAVALVGGLERRTIKVTTTTTTFLGESECGTEVALWDAIENQWISIRNNCTADCQVTSQDAPPGDYHWEVRIFACG